MITEPFEPISEPRACGWPYHGVIARKRNGDGGEVVYRWVLNGVESQLPADFKHVPLDTNISFKVRHPDAEPLDLTPEEIADELAAGRVWFDFATIAGRLSLFYGQNLGQRSWVAVLDDGFAWVVTLVPGYMQAENRYRWMMNYNRTAIGPGSGLSEEALPSRSFWVELEEAGGSFSAYSAQQASGGVVNPGRVMDIALHGDRAIVNGSTIRVISTTDLTPHGLDLATVSGELPFMFNAVVASGQISVYHHGPYGSYREASEMVSSSMDYSGDALASMPVDENSKALPAGAVLPISSPRVLSIDPNSSNIWVQYHLYNIPPRVEVATYECWINAHLPEDGSDGFVVYKIRTEWTATQNYIGQMCAYSEYYSQGHFSPDFVRCPPPSTASVVTTHTIRQTIEYGEEIYEGERTWTTIEAANGVTVYDCITRPAWMSSTGNYSIFGSLDILQVHSQNGFAFYRGRPAMPTKVSLGSLIAVASVPFPMQLGDAYAEHEPSWNGNYFSMRTPVVDEDHLRSQSLTVFPAVMARFNMVGNYAVESMPAAAQMPNGLYYKGKHVSPWLPAYNDVWTMDLNTYEVHVFPRAPLQDADGYLYAIHV